MFGLYQCLRPTRFLQRVPSVFRAESGRPHDIYRCPNCQIALWSDYGRAGFRFVRVGTLDTPHCVVPDVHIYVRSKVPWLRLPEGARSFDAYYDAKVEWPAESLTRRQAVLAKLPKSA